MTNQLNSKSFKAGEVRKFPSGSQTYLSPLPLPTGLPPADHNQMVAEVRNNYLELGAYTPNVFGWQVTIGIPMGMLIQMCLVLPIIMFAAVFLGGYGFEDALNEYLIFTVVGFKWGGA